MVAQGYAFDDTAEPEAEVMKNEPIHEPHLQMIHLSSYIPSSNQ